MSRGKRAALVLRCGHVIPAAGRVDDTRRIIDSYTFCPVCRCYEPVVSVSTHLHHVPEQVGAGRG